MSEPIPYAVKLENTGSEYQVRFIVGSQSFVLATGFGDKFICGEVKNVLERALADIKANGTPWVVKVGRWKVRYRGAGSRLFYRVKFVWKEMTFVITRVEVEKNNPEEAKDHCRFIAKMFLKAMAHAGFKASGTSARKSRSPSPKRVATTRHL